MATSLANQVSTNIQKERSRQLDTLEKSIRQICLDEQMNKSHFVLNAWTGYTDNFIRVVSKPAYDLDLENNISKIMITGIAQDASHCLAECI